MSFLETFQLAIGSIKGSKMRTFLTMLGIIIGVTAVIVIVGLGNGMQGYITDTFSDMGTTNIEVGIYGRGSSRDISVEDMYELADANPGVIGGLSPGLSSMSKQLKIGNETVTTTNCQGVSEDYLDMLHYEVAEGRGIEYIDVKERKKICVVGKWLADTYFGGDALGKTLRYGNDTFTIVGVLAQRMDEMEEGGADDYVMLPYATVARLGQSMVNYYLVQAADETQVPAAKKLIEDRLYEEFQDEYSYYVMSMQEMMDQMNGMISAVMMVLAVIAGISLLVGGIGIMNIMLVSVTERTREIGIRKALGAKESVILRQFVIEAATTSGLGGLIGIALGYGISAAATPLISSMIGDSMSVTPSLPSVMMAFGISAAIGIFFGYLPAKKAANLNPIDALRYD